MKGLLKQLLWGLGIVALLVLAGITIEYFRQSALRSWAGELGGRFEPGGFLSGAEMPESEAFDAGVTPGAIRYHNVVRYQRQGIGYAVAQYTRTFRSTKGETQTVHHVVCFVRLPKADWPPVEVGFPKSALGKQFREIAGFPDPIVPLPIPVFVEGFREHYEVRPWGPEGTVTLERASALLPEAVQKEIVAQQSLLAGFQAKGAVIRVQAVEWTTGYPHRELAAASERLAALWRP